MMKKSGCIVVLMMTWFSGAGISADPSAFALDLYAELRGEEGNLFFSPYSIAMALAMTYGGANGATAEEMADALRMEARGPDLHGAFAALNRRMAAVQVEGDVALQVANSLWPQQDVPFRSEFLDLLRTYYDAEVTPVDYRNETEAARLAINRWVEDATRDKIKDLIVPGVLNAMTRMVLVNAIYFKGDWAHPFAEDRTEEAAFFRTAGDSVRTPLMTRQSRFGYTETETLQVLDLPYRGDALSMLVLLPRDLDGLPALEANLSPENLEAWITSLRQREVKVYLPKFKITWGAFVLNRALQAMGMELPFHEGEADFSGMNGRTNDLFISSVVHKAFVEVNEEGTEAAAATGVIVATRAMMPVPIPEFRADRPFLFFIRDTQTGSVLFMGRVADPTATGEG